MNSEWKVCPIMPTKTTGNCLGKDCAWFCGFAEECAIPLLACMFADSEICRNVFKKGGAKE